MQRSNLDANSEPQNALGAKRPSGSYLRTPEDALGRLDPVLDPKCPDCDFRVRWILSGLAPRLAPGGPKLSGFQDPAPKNQIFAHFRAKRPYKHARVKLGHIRAMF